MILFIECQNHEGNDILINWKEISVARKDDNTVKIFMTNGEVIKIKHSFKEFRKILLEYELMLDTDFRIIAPDREGGGWMMVD